MPVAVLVVLLVLVSVRPALALVVSAACFLCRLRRSFLLLDISLLLLDLLLLLDISLLLLLNSLLLPHIPLLLLLNILLLPHIPLLPLHVLLLPHIPLLLPLHVLLLPGIPLLLLLNILLLPHIPLLLLLNILLLPHIPLLLPLHVLLLPGIALLLLDILLLPHVSLLLLPIVLLLLLLPAMRVRALTTLIKNLPAHRFAWLVAIAARLDRALPIQLVRIAAAAVIPLIGWQRRGPGHGTTIPAIPSIALPLPVATPMLAPARGGVFTPAAKIGGRASVVAHRHAQHEQGHISW